MAPEWMAVIVAIGSLFVSGLALWTSYQSNKATIFEQRFGVYRDAEDFIRAWMQHGDPDFGEPFYKLIDAWNRSHFLFDEPVTAYLRQLWLDAIAANSADDRAQKITAGSMQGNAEEEIETAYGLLRKYASEDGPLRKAFLPHMKISSQVLSLWR